MPPDHELDALREDVERETVQAMIREAVTEQREHEAALAALDPGTDWRSVRGVDEVSTAHDPHTARLAFERQRATYLARRRDVLRDQQRRRALANLRRQAGLDRFVAWARPAVRNRPPR